MLRFPTLPKPAMPVGYPVTGVQAVKDSVKRVPDTVPVPEAVARLEQELADNTARRAAIAGELPALEQAYSDAALGWDVSQLVEERLKMNAAADRMRQLRRELADLEADAPLLRKRLEAVKAAARLEAHQEDLERLDRLVAEYAPVDADFRALVTEAAERAGELRQRGAAIRALYARCRDYAAHSGAEPPADGYKLAGHVPVVREHWFTLADGGELARKELGLDD
jgi:chromosome segregation ATPase